MNIQQDFKELLQLLEENQDIDAPFISKKHLLQNKNATPRIKDKADAKQM